MLVNCAAYTRVDDAESHAGTAFAVNAYAVEALAAACHDLGRPLVHVSTDYVFDGEADRPYPVDAKPGPLNVYGASKLVGEVLAHRAHPEGTLIVRTSSLFGLAGARPGGGGNFVETMLRVGRERGRLRVVRDHRMTPTSSADLAGAILGLLAEEASAATYHYANAGETSWHEFARAILEEAGVEAEVEAVPGREYRTPARRPRYSVLDTRTVTDRLGPAPEWRDALERYMEARRDVIDPSEAR